MYILGQRQLSRIQIQIFSYKFSFLLQRSFFSFVWCIAMQLYAACCSFNRYGSRLFLNLLYIVLVLKCHRVPGALLDLRSTVGSRIALKNVYRRNKPFSKRLYTYVSDFR